MAKEIQAGQRLWIILFTDKTRVNIFISSLRGTTPQFLSTTRNSITPNPLNPIKNLLFLFILQIAATHGHLLMKKIQIVV